MSMTFVRVLAGIPSWVAGRKCCRSGCPWCFPVMVAIELPGFQYSVFTLYSNRFKRKTVTHNLSIFEYFMWHDLWKIFSNLKKNNQFLLDGFSYVLHSLDGSEPVGFTHRIPCPKLLWDLDLVPESPGWLLSRNGGGWKGESISGVFPSGPSWHVTAYFLKLITTCTRDTFSIL